nr:hypothetical protein Iba_chr06fCG9220 [Ipomoea batatas]
MLPMIHGRSKLAWLLLQPIPMGLGTTAKRTIRNARRHRLNFCKDLETICWTL